MNYDDLLLLKTVKEVHSITKAAEHLYITQPALTYRLQNLEKEFGVKILTRRANGSFFTPQGEYILKYAEEAMEHLKLTKEYVRNMETQVQGTLRLGICTAFAQYNLAPFLKKYHAYFPDVKVLPKIAKSTILLPILKKNDIDVAILRGNIHWTEKTHVIMEEPFCIISAHAIDFEQLPYIPWIQYEAAKNNGFIEQLNAWWQEYSSLPPSQIIEVDLLETCMQLVSYGIGWAIVPKIHINKRYRLFSYPVVWQSGEVMTKKTFLTYKERTLEDPSIKSFVDFILNEYSI